jgi:hypothetical protein
VGSLWLGHQSGRISVYKILEEAAPESVEVGLQFETRLYGHMAAVSGLLLSPEYRQRKMALSTLGFVIMKAVLWIRILIRMALSTLVFVNMETVLWIRICRSVCLGASRIRIRIRTNMSRIHNTSRQTIVRIRSCICSLIQSIPDAGTLIFKRRR